MSEEKNPPTTTTDDDLLAHAIPIDAADDGEEPVELEPVSEAESDAIDLSNPDDAIELASDEEVGPAKKIESFDHHQGYQENWKRQPVKTGAGASHVRTFVAKLRLDAIDHLDEQVNEWLDAHPEYEVKIVSTSVGVLTGKLREEALFMNVWV